MTKPLGWGLLQKNIHVKIINYYSKVFKKYSPGIKLLSLPGDQVSVCGLCWQRVLHALKALLHFRSLVSRIMGRFAGAECGTVQSKREKLRCKEESHGAGPTRQ